MNINTTGFALTVGIIATIVATVLAYLYIIPEKKRDGLNKLGQFIHDIFNFKFLIIEKILRFFYVLCTIACICIGLSMIFGFTAYQSYYSKKIFTDWYGIYGILFAIVGPIAVRLAYEGLMMFLLLVRNVMEINAKLKSQTDAQEYQAPSFKELFAKENFVFLKGTKAEAPAEQTNDEN